MSFKIKRDIYEAKFFPQSTQYLFAFFRLFAWTSFVQPVLGTLLFTISPHAEQNRTGTFDREWLKFLHRSSCIFFSSSNLKLRQIFLSL